MAENSRATHVILGGHTEEQYLQPVQSAMFPSSCSENVFLEDQGCSGVGDAQLAEPVPSGSPSETENSTFRLAEQSSTAYTVCY
uniref:Uncharacterized protein n=1 Tax=Oryza meridionalis TaxID=40149 RepID=A0A0E0DPX2_9ORYZ